jgi:hypothetical protein
MKLKNLLLAGAIAACVPSAELAASEGIEDRRAKTVTVQNEKDQTIARRRSQSRQVIRRLNDLASKVEALMKQSPEFSGS